MRNINKPLRNDGMLSFRYILHILFYKKCPRRNLIEEDIDHYSEVIGLTGSYAQKMCFLFGDRPEFRNLFYYRLSRAHGLIWILKLLAPPVSTLYILTPHIGGGLFIQHGFATILCAKSIGKHCHINQQVTIGYKGSRSPVIGDDVTITCGAKVLGGVTVGNNVTIGANAVVIKDVPSNTTVVGVPAYIVKRNGKKVREELH